MLTNQKRELINRCLELSREQPKSTVYGVISKNGQTHLFTSEAALQIVIEKYGDKVYCKAKNGYLTL